METRIGKKRGGAPFDYEQARENLDVNETEKRFHFALE